jgi:murein DD-endopeptidase MepM/ murein hydrolase activator NlpD
MTKLSLGKLFPQWVENKVRRRDAHSIYDLHYLSDESKFQILTEIGAPVLAVWDGVVAVVNENKDNKHLENSKLAHLTNFAVIVGRDNIDYMCGHIYPAVRVGEKVRKGDLLGHVVNKFPKGVKKPHIHFGIRRGLEDLTEIEFEGYERRTSPILLPSSTLYTPSILE